MKILHINLQNTWRGGEQQFGYLALELKRLGVAQALVCQRGSDLERFAQENKIDYLALPKGFLKVYANIKRMARYIQKNGFDLIHCNESKGLGLGVWTKILFTPSVKILLQRHVIFPVKGWLSKQIKYSPKYIDSVICVSTQAAKVIKSTTYNTKVEVIPTMTPTNYPYTSKNLLSKYGIQPKGPVVGYIAALTFEKDHQTFLRAAKELLELDPTVEFVLAGSGKLEAEIKNQIQQLGLQDKVHLLGFVPGAHDLLSELDLVLFTSTKEGCPTTLLDAFVAKVPVVSTAYPGSSDLIQDGENGFLAQVGDSKTLAQKAHQVLQNPDLAQKITQQAYQVAQEKFSITQVSDKIVGVYRSLIGS